jgi:hypothetical protein
MSGIISITEHLDAIDAKNAEIKRLQYEVVNRNQRALDGDQAVAMRDDLMDKLECQRIELAEAQRDAARYRWLRTIGPEQVRVLGHYAGECIDAAIDAAMKEGER